MKFGRRLLEELMEPDWEMYYVQYHTLKKIIFALVQAQKDNRVKDVVTLRRQFYARLAANVIAAEAFAKGILSKVRGSHVKVIAGAQAVRHPSNLPLTLENDQALADFAYWSEEVASLLKFCVTNRTAMRKIIKKLEKNVRRETTAAGVAVHGAVPQEAWLAARPNPFEKIQQELTSLMRIAKEVEYGVMTVSTQLSARVRSIRALRFAEIERRKLRRVQDFESELVRPFMIDRCAMRDVYLEWRPLRVALYLCAFAVLGMAFLCDAFDTRRRLRLACLQAIAFFAWTFAAVLYAVQAIVVQAKLGRLALRSRQVAGLAAAYAFIEVLFLLCATPEQPLSASSNTRVAVAGSIAGVVDEVEAGPLLLAMGIVASVESAIHLRYSLGPRWAALPRALAQVAVLGAFLAPWLDPARPHLPRTLAMVAAVLLAISFAETVSRIRIDIQLRDDVKVRL